MIRSRGWEGKSADSWEGDVRNLPIALAATVLLIRSWIDAGVAALGEVAWEMLLWGGGAIGKASVVTVGSLVGASH